MPDATSGVGTFSLRVEDRTFGLIRPSGPLRLRAESLATGHRVTLDLAGESADESGMYTLPVLPAGQYRLTVFQDRDNDKVHDDCPFPPGPDDPLHADRLDNVFGQAEARVEVGRVIDVAIERHICGPGEPRTGLRGTIALAPEVDAVPGPVLLLIEPLPDLRNRPQPTDGGDAGQLVGPPAPLRIPLLPHGLSGEAAFDFGELVPGRYQLTFFVDGDGDASPTPCGPGPGGADRYLAPPLVVDIAAGERLPLGPPVILSEVAGCPAALTGVRGTLDLSGPLREALAEQPTPDPYGERFAGEVRLAVLDPGTGDTIQSATLFADLTARPLPRPFTLTGLPPGLWRLAIWLDRDGDGRFAPCGGLPAGHDAIYVGRDEVRVRNGHVLDLGALALEEVCPAAPPTGIRGGLYVELEDGPEGSGRPVRLELYPAAQAGERLSFPLFENHRALTIRGGEEILPAQFTRDVPPGQYEARLYLDTDRNGGFASCAVAPFADRASTGLVPVTVEAGQVTDLGPLDLELHGCPVPAVAIEPTITMNERARAARAPLRVAIEEAGGWRMDRALRGAFTAEDAPFRADAIPLAPGRYRVTAYVDANTDGALQPCGAEVPDPLVGQVEVVLGEMNPVAQPEIRLEAACSR